jgi:hypothetical protein
MGGGVYVAVGPGEVRDDGFKKDNAKANTKPITPISNAYLHRMSVQ